jgi:hypothetical protein
MRSRGSKKAGSASRSPISPWALLLPIGAILIAVLLASGLGSSDAGEAPAPAPESDAPAAAPKPLFAPESFWNSALPEDAPTDPRSRRFVDALSAEAVAEHARGIGPWIATEQCSTPLYVVPRAQPPLRVFLTHPQVFWRRGLARAFRRVPLPPEARPANCVDGHLTVWQPASDRLWEFFHLRRQDGRWLADWGGAMKRVSRSSGFYSGASWPGLSASNWGATASSLPVVGGVMLLRELEAGEVDHALAINLPVTRAGVFAWPAQRSDGTGPPSALPEGARLRLDPGLDLSSLDLPPLTRVIARAAQRYGLVVRDKTGEGNGIALFAEDRTRWKADPYKGGAGLFGKRTPDQILAAFPWQHLQVLRMKLCRQAPCRRA